MLSNSNAELVSGESGGLHPHTLNELASLPQVVVTGEVNGKSRLYPELRLLNSELFEPENRQGLKKDLLRPDGLDHGRQRRMRTRVRSRRCRKIWSTGNRAHLDTSITGTSHR